MKYNGILLAGNGSLSTRANDSITSLLQKKLQNHFADSKLVYACTSQSLLSRSKTLLSVDSALASFTKEGVKTLRILPLFFAPGREWELLLKKLSLYKKTFETISLLSPLLCSEQNRSEIAKIIIQENHFTPQEKVLLAGHGSMGIANECYTSLEKTFFSMGYLNVRIKTLQDFSFQGEEDFFTGELTLLPLFFCYGTHAEKDLFQNENSIASCLKKRGIHLKEKKQGLLESEAFCSYLCKRIAGEEDWNENW